MASGLIQASYTIIMSDLDQILASEVKVGDQVKSLKTDTKEIVDATVSGIVANQSLSSVYYSHFDSGMGFLLASGACIWEDGKSLWVSNDSALAQSRFDIIPHQALEGMQYLSTSLDDLNELKVEQLHSFRDEDETYFMNFELTGGDNFFVIPILQKISSICVHI